MANEKETPGPKEEAGQPDAEPKEKKSAAKKEAAAEAPKTSEKKKSSKPQKTEPVPKTAGSEEMQSQKSEPPSEAPQPAEPKAAADEEPIPAVPAAEPSTPAAGSSQSAPPPPPEPESDPLKTFGLYAGVALLILIVLIVGASMQNMRKYYVISRDGAVEIWRGQFSPMGKERLLVMPGTQPLDGTQEVYSKQEVYPLIFEFYLAKADALMDASGAPNFEDVKTYLTRSLQYATTAEMRTRARTRIQTIDRLTLLYKADVAAGRGTMEGYRAALASLQQAETLSPDEIEANLIQEKIQSIEKQMAALEQSKTAATAAPASPEAETPSAAGGEEAGKESTAPQSPETGNASPDKTGSTKKPVDF
jgi:hypothetical protein